MVVNENGVVSGRHLVLLNTTIFVCFSLKIIFDEVIFCFENKTHEKALYIYIYIRIS
jgi:hypothetical protein